MTDSQPTHSELIILMHRAAAYVAESKAMTARKRHRTSKHLFKQWVAAKARLCAVEARHEQL